MSRKKQIASLASVALLVIAAVWWRTTTSASDAVAPAAATVRTERERSPDLGAAPVTAQATADDRAEISDGEQPQIPARALPPYEFTLEFAVTDADDAPLAGTSVFVAPRMQPLNRAGETDSAGLLTVRWRGFVESMDVVVAASADTRAPSDLRLVHVRAAAEQRVAIRAASATYLITFFQGAGQSTEIEVSTSAPVLSGVLALSGRFTMYAGTEVEAMRASADGTAYFVDPWMARCVAAEKADSVDTANHGRALTLALQALGYAGAEQEEAAVISGVTFHPPPPQFELRGRVLGPEDKPLAQVLVRLRREGEQAWRPTRSDDAGYYQFVQLAVSNYDLVAGDGDNGLARTTIVGSADAKLNYDARLDRGRELQGRLLSREGQPLTNWTVELLREDALAPWIDFANTDDAGAFRIPSLPGGSFTLLANPIADNPNSAIPLLIARNAWPSDERQDFPVVVEAFGRLRVALVDEHDQPVIGAVVRIWRDDVGRGRLVDSIEAPNVFTLDGQFPGTYRLEIGAAERGWIAVEQVFVKAGQTLDLGVIHLAAPARVEVAADSGRPGEPVGGIFLRAGREVESLSLDLAGDPPLAIEIGAGEYEFARALEGLARGVTLSLRAAETKKIELPRAIRRDDH